MLVLLAQLSPKPGDVGANAARVARALADRPDAELAVFPELFLSGYALKRMDELALVPDSPPLQAVARAAAEARTAVVVGFAERTEHGIANAVACFDADGTFAGTYRKTHLFGAEAERFVAGGEQVVVRLAGRLVGLLICFDIEFPEPARALARAGAQVLVTASANMAPYHADHRLATCARALDNRLPHLYANRVGSESGLLFTGGSRVADSGGAILREADADREHLLVTSVTVGAAVETNVDYLSHARGELPVRSPRISTSSGGTP